MKAKLNKIVAWGWALMIVVLSLMPGATVQKWIWSDLFSFDKLAHFLLYAGLILLIGNAYFAGKSNVTSVVIAGSVLGILLEVLQNQMYLGRHFEFLDIIANISGLIAGALLHRQIVQKSRL